MTTPRRRQLSKAYELHERLWLQSRGLVKRNARRKKVVRKGVNRWKIKNRKGINRLGKYCRYRWKILGIDL